MAASDAIEALLAEAHRAARLRLLVEIHTEAERALRRGDSLVIFATRLLEIGAREMGQ